MVYKEISYNIVTIKNAFIDDSNRKNYSRFIYEYMLFQKD